MFKYFLLLISFLSFSTNLLASGECSRCLGYDKYCASLGIVDSYECVLKYKSEIAALCVLKVEDLFKNCTMKELRKCDTPENDSDNLYEKCLSRYHGHCGEIGKKYL